ncbi:hypothetical protein LY78DRAFT_125005 [Colletotrichum sublineola]|nr:hypothetical protein LY78DRAFT_125005 [Colletotrichum sublineola]
MISGKKEPWALVTPLPLHPPLFFISLPTPHTPGLDPTNKPFMHIVCVCVCVCVCVWWRCFLTIFVGFFVGRFQAAGRGRSTGQRGKPSRQVR